MAKRKSKKKDRASRSTAASARRRAEKHQNGFEPSALKVPEGVQMFQLKTGKPLRLDILPYEVSGDNPYADKGELHYERTFFVHRGIGAEPMNTYVCPRKTANKPCPVCEYRSGLMNGDVDEKEENEQLFKTLAPKERQLFNVIDLNEKDKGVQLWDCSYHLFGKMLDAEIRNADEDDDFINFSDLEGGKTLKLGVEERQFGQGKPFAAVETIHFKNRREDYEEGIFDAIIDLDEALKVLSYDELKKILLEAEPDEDEDKDKDKKPKRTSKKKKAAKKEEVKPEDEDDDFEDDDFEDDDFDDEDDELEDEDEDDDFDDEDDDDEDEDFDDEDDEDDEDEDEDFDDDKSSKKKASKKKVSAKKSTKKGAQAKGRSAKARTK